jgi:RimJ/RimL family protein N-acetyltransferase
VLALTADGGSAVGLADLRFIAVPEPRTANFGVLVEDAWQHRGLGTALVRRIAETAVDHGLDELTGTVPADAVRITRLLRRAGLRPTAVQADGTLRLRVPLATPAAIA